MTPNEIIICRLLTGTTKTQKQLVVETGLTSNAIRYAIRKFTAQGILEKKFNFADARLPLYRIKTPQQPVAVKAEAVL